MSKSGIKNVVWHNRNQVWVLQYYSKGKVVHVHDFKDINEAIKLKARIDNSADKIKAIDKFKTELKESLANEIILKSDHAVIVTNKGEHVLIDLEDVDKVRVRSWNVHKGYARMKFNNKAIDLHRFVMGCEPGDGNLVDHIDHNTLDNRKSNLRLADYTTNQYNRAAQKSNTSGTVGVHLGDNGKWIARIWVYKKAIHLGSFKNKEDAIKARKEAEEKYHGEFKYKGEK